MSYKVTEFSNHYMVRHPDGKSFPVAKKGISDEMHTKIKSYMKGTPQNPAKYSDGGEVQAPDDLTADRSPASDFQAMPMPSPDAMTGPAPAPLDPGVPPPAPVFQYTPGKDPVPLNKTAFAQSNPIHGVSGSFETGIDPTPPVSPQPGQNLYNPGGSKPGQAGTDPMSSMPGFAQQAAGLQQSANATSAAAAQSAKVLDQSIKDQQSMHEEYQNQLNGVTQKINQVSNDVLNGKIDPNRVWSNMGTGNKILASISLALGGIGSGLTGKSNAAMDVINKSIDNDIEAQKADLGNKNNLLNHYMQQYHNIDAAENATRLHLATVVGSQMQKIAAQQGGAQAQAAAQMGSGQLLEKYAPLVKQQAMYGLQSAMSGADGSEGGLPRDVEAKLLPVLSANDKEYGAKRVIVNNRVYQHTGTPADAQELRSFTALSEPIRENVKRLAELGPLALNPTSASAQEAEALRASLATQIASLRSSAIGSKRVSDVESEKAEQQVSDPTKFKQLMNGGVRNSQFFRDLDTTSDALYRQNLQGYKGRPQTVPYGSK